MKRPYCNQEMTEGFIQSAGKVFFTTTEYEMAIIPGEKDQLLTKNNWRMPTCKALRCQNCKKVLVDYSEE